MNKYQYPTIFGMYPINTRSTGRAKRRSKKTWVPAWLFKWDQIKSPSKYHRRLKKIKK